MRRVLWITHVYPRHDADPLGIFLHRLGKGLAARDVALRVVAPGAPGVPDSETRDGIEIRRFDYPGLQEQPLAYTGEMHRGAARRPGQFVGFLNAYGRSVREQIAEFAPDVLHAHWWLPGGLVARRSAGRLPWVLSMHGTDVRILRKSVVPWPLALWVLSGADALLPVSPFIARQLRGLRLPADRSEVLPMPADDTVFRDTGRTRDDPPSFVVPARLTPQKRVDVAIRAFAQAQGDGLDATLHILGEGDERASLEELARKLGADTSVRFHDFVPAEELARFFGQARAVVLPSENEGYGLVLVEAALCGAVPVGARSGAITDLIDDGKTGYLAEPGDTAAFAALFRKLAADGDGARMVAAAARAAAESRTTGPLADRLVDLYGRLSGDASARRD